MKDPDPDPAQEHSSVTDAPNEPSAPGARRAGAADVAAVGVIAALIAGAICWWWFAVVAAGPVEPLPANERGKLLVSIYDPPTRSVEAALIRGDGQIFAALATDPAVRRPEQVRGGPEEQAYRYQRMGYGWAGWLASGGQRDAVPWALMAVTVAATGLLVAASGRYLLDRGIDPRVALVMVALPGVFIDLTWIGPEVLGTALLVVGLNRWLRPERTRAQALAAVACFAAAGLCRETLLLVPAVLALEELAARRWRPMLVVAASALPYVAWVLVLHARIGAWPKGSVGGRLSIVPFAGLVESAQGWTPGDALAAGVVLVLAVAALALGWRSELRWLIVGHVAFAATLGAPVWHRFPDYSRVLLPLAVLSILAIAVSFGERERRSRPLGDAVDEARGTRTRSTAAP